jgi:tRNA pseudouridine38-40 synthase
VAHFDSSAQRSQRSWLLGINSNLPADINVNWVAEVPSDFHARFSARSRSYQYVIVNRAVRSALQRHRAWLVRQPLDEERMNQAAQLLVGEHDFSSFRASSCQAHSPVRTMSRLQVTRKGEYLYIDCSANAFLHHMVRNLAGSLMRVGIGEESVGWMKTILEARDRTVSGITAPAAGLTLTAVGYPDFALPESGRDNL